MITVYLASRYARREEMEGYARRLEDLGYAIGSHWVYGKRDILANPGEAKRFATLDRGDILRSDLIISFAEPKEVDYPRGSRHWETCTAYERGKVVYIVGRFGVELECVFHNLDGIVIFDNWEILLPHLENLIIFEKARDDMRQISPNGDNPYWMPIPGHRIADPGHSFAITSR
jgi:hypothetical protein